MATCSNGGAGQSTDFIDPAMRQRTIDDHVTFVRDFLALFDRLVEFSRGFKWSYSQFAFEHLDTFPVLVQSGTPLVAPGI